MSPPPGGSPPPPAPGVSNRFSFGKLKRNARRGTAKLIVRVPGPGRVVLRKSKQLRKHVVRAEQKGRVGVTLRPRGKLKRKLARAVKDPRVTRVRARVRARVTYRPRGGEPRTKSKRVRLVRRG